jgi:hypothetical protein
MGTTGERWRRILAAEKELQAALKGFGESLDDLEGLSDEDLLAARQRVGSLMDELKTAGESLDSEAKRRGLASFNA